MCVIPSGVINRRHRTPPEPIPAVHILSGKVTANHTYTGDDRRVITRFDKDNIRANQPLLDLITDFANSKGVTPAQIVGLDAAQERLHRAHPRLAQAGTHPGKPGRRRRRPGTRSSHRSKQSWRRSRSTEPHRRGHRQAPRNHLTHPIGQVLRWCTPTTERDWPGRPRTAAPFQFAAPQLGALSNASKRPPVTVLTNTRGHPPALFDDERPRAHSEYAELPQGMDSARVAPQFRVLAIKLWGDHRGDRTLGRPWKHERHGAGVPEGTASSYHTRSARHQRAFRWRRQAIGRQVNRSKRHTHGQARKTGC